jgi:hypothetical protein
MIGQSIIINFNALDLDSNTVISTTKRVANIGKLERQSSFTNKLNLPTTANNLLATGLTQGDDDSPLKYSRQIGQVISNGISVLPNAEIMTERVGNRIDILINAGNSIFFDLVSKLKLRELDMPELDHVWNMQNEYDSRVNTWEDGYIYGILDTGNQSRQFNELQCQGIVPQVFAKYVFKKIAENFGYTMYGSWWEEEFFNQVICTIAEPRTGDRLQEQVVITAEKTSNQTFGTNYNTYIRIGAYDTISSDVWNVFNVNSPNAYEVKFPGKYTFSARFETNVTKGLPGDPLSIVEARVRLRCYQILNGAVTVLSESQLISTSTGAFDGTLTIDVELQDELFESQDSDVYCFVEAYQREGATGAPSDPYYRTILEIDYCRFNVDSVVAPTTHYNRPINIQESLPDWTCGKFINEICNLAGVIPLVDEYDKKIRLFMINELDQNKISPYLWQDKLDLTNEPEYTFKIDGYARSMNFYWAQDERFGYTLSVDNEQLQERADYIKSSFNYMTSSIILGKNWTVGKISLWDSQKSTLKLDKKSYIGLIRQRNTNVVYTSYNESDIVGGTQDYSFVFFNAQSGSPYSLNWVYLYNTYYKTVMSGIINNMLQVDLDVRLNEFDVNDFDFSRPVWLENPSGYYFLQSIQDFTTSKESTRVQLIRIV